MCKSFNYHTGNHVCELNNATRDNSADFIELLGSAYYEHLNTLPSLNETTRYSSCQMWYKAGHRDSGIYIIYPDLNGIQVYCDMETDGGGWIVFQRRQDGSVDFYRNWTDYQYGFGDLSGEFWLGNHYLRTLTAIGKWQLHIQVEDWESNTAWAAYREFAIFNDNYTLHVGSYDVNSTVGQDAFKKTSNRRGFTTRDRDNDNRDTPEANCAIRHEGAWWFNRCFNVHLNGKYYPHADVANKQGIQWELWKGNEYSLKKCSMKIRELL
ncbi:ryncolin-1-like [Asterias rubens]|uniref:ryncolin-1-like n=1 Tax=Asterias rubens TaxID=7604 RepID=UPI001454F99D|nr:ryncolin-1-like [Asterias rubens]